MQVTSFENHRRFDGSQWPVYDAASLQACIDHCYLEGYQTLNLQGHDESAGGLILDQTVTVPEGIHLEGNGRSNCHLVGTHSGPVLGFVLLGSGGNDQRYGGGGFSRMSIKSEVASADAVVRVTDRRQLIFDDFTLSGGIDPNDRRALSGIHFLGSGTLPGEGPGSAWNRVSNFYIEYVDGPGIYLDGGTASFTNRFKVWGGHVQSSNIGYHVRQCDTHQIEAASQQCDIGVVMENASACDLTLHNEADVVSIDWRGVNRQNIVRGLWDLELMQTDDTQFRRRENQLMHARETQSFSGLFALHTLGRQARTVTSGSLRWDDGSVFVVPASSTVTLPTVDIPTQHFGGSEWQSYYDLRLIVTGAGIDQPDFSGNIVRWPGGSQPVLSGRSVLDLFTLDGGATWDAAILSDAVS